jgi:hypothetical protein
MAPSAEGFLDSGLVHRATPRVTGVVSLRVTSSSTDAAKSCLGWLDARLNPTTPTTSFPARARDLVAQTTTTSTESVDRSRIG